MMTALTREIYAKASEFVDGKVSLRQFEEWFVPATWSVHRANDQVAESLADEIDLSISEHTDGLLSIDELRLEFANTIRPFAPAVPRIFDGSPMMTTSSDSPIQVFVAA